MSHRRRGVGVGRSGATTKKLTQKKADELKAVSFQSALNTLEALERKLTEYAQRHEKEIQTDPVFRQRFLQMCGPLGIDPLQSSKKKSAGTLFGGLFTDMGDFYHELAVQVAEVCLASRSRNGGIMSVTEIQSILQTRKTRLGTVQSRLNNNRTNTPISTSDIEIAVQQLSKLGGGFRTARVETTNTTMVISVPTELDHDHMQIMAIAAASAADEEDTRPNATSMMGGITLDQVRHATGWTQERAQRGLDLLLQQGMAWIDTYRGETYYWFPSIWQEKRATVEAERM